MKVTKDKVEKCQAHLTVEMEPDELADGLTRAYNRLVRKYAVPGFRKGKTPRPILEQYLGKGAFLEDAVEHMASEAYEGAVKQQELKPIARPHIDLEKTEPVIYKMIVPLEPVVTLGDYHQLKAVKEVIPVKDEEIAQTIEDLRHKHSLWEPVDRQVNSGDLVNLDIESQVDSLPFINQKDAEFQVVKDSEFPIKGFAEELIGMKKGEAKEFKLSFAADYQRAELAGKEASFKVEIKEIKQEKLPEVDDDFAVQVNPDFKTLDELKSKIKEEMTRQAEDLAQRNFEQQMLDEIIGMSQIEYPDIVVEGEIEGLVREQMQRWQLDEKGMDEYLKTINRTPQQLRDDLRPIAEKKVQRTLVLTEVAKAEKVEISPSDFEDEIATLTKDVASDRREKMVEILKMPQSQVNMASLIATRKTILKLIDFTQSKASIPPEATTTEVKEVETTQKEAQA